MHICLCSILWFLETCRNVVFLLQIWWLLCFCLHTGWFVSRGGCNLSKRANCVLYWPGCPPDDWILPVCWIVVLIFDVQAHALHLCSFFWTFWCVGLMRSHSNCIGCKGCVCFRRSTKPRLSVYRVAFWICCRSVVFKTSTAFWALAQYELFHSWKRH